MTYADRRVTPLWLSHHYPEDYQRCVRVGKTHVCRRCSALYPVALLAMGIGLALGAETIDGSRIVVLGIVLLPLPAVVEFVLEHLGMIGYQPVRQACLTSVLAVGLGLGFARYLRQPSDPVFWGAVLLYGGSCLTAALTGRRGRARISADGTEPGEEDATDGP